MSAANLRELRAGGSFFEGPRWHEGKWWVSDFYRHLVVTVTTDGVEETVCTVPGQPSGLGWLPDGSLVVVSMRDHRLLRRTPDGAVSTHADLTGLCGGHLNDLVVDREGRSFVGEFGFDLMAGQDAVPAKLIRVDLDGRVQVVAEDLQFPNGSVILPDGRTLIVGETLGCRYTAFTINEDGSLSDRRVWAQLAPTPVMGSVADTLPQVTVAPDGCGLDADGHIWAADAVGARCIRVAPGGSITDEVAMPDGLGCFACMLGGPDGRTLMICAAPDFFEASRKDTRQAKLLVADVDVPGAGLP